MRRRGISRLSSFVQGIEARLWRKKTSPVKKIDDSWRIPRRMIETRFSYGYLVCMFLRTATHPRCWIRLSAKYRVSREPPLGTSHRTFASHPYPATMAATVSALRVVAPVAHVAARKATAARTALVVKVRETRIAIARHARTTPARRRARAWIAPGRRVQPLRSGRAHARARRPRPPAPPRLHDRG